MSESCLYNTQPGNVACGEPATHRYPTGGGKWMTVCAFHADMVYRNTRKKTNPTPLVKTVMEEKSIRPSTAPAASTAQVSPPVVASGPSMSDRLRAWRESFSEGDKL